MPSVSEKQRRFMGADLARARAGKKTRTGMSEDQLADYARKPLGKGQASIKKEAKAEGESVSKEKRDMRMGKGQSAHPGFAAVQAKIAKSEGVPMKNAGAILANSSRNASSAAKKANPRLKKVAGKGQAPPPGMSDPMSMMPPSMGASSMPLSLGGAPQVMAKMPPKKMKKGPNIHGKPMNTRQAQRGAGGGPPMRASRLLTGR